MKLKQEKPLKQITILILILLGACAPGCHSPRTVLVKPGSVIKIGPKTKGFIYSETSNGWERSAKKVVIPEGWYALPP